MNKRKVWGAFIVVASLFMLVGCGSEEASDQVTLYVSGDASEGVNVK